MKKAVVILVLIVIAVVGLFYVKHQSVAGKAALEVEKYIVTRGLPEYTPLSKGFLPGSMENPAYLVLRSDRYVMVIMSIDSTLARELGYERVEKVVAPEEKQEEIVFKDDLDDTWSSDEEIANAEAELEARAEAEEAQDEGPTGLEPIISSLDDKFTVVEDEEWATDPAMLGGYDPQYNYPEISLIFDSGSTIKAKVVSAWPDSAHADQMEAFQNYEQWYPQPGDDVDKRYYIAAAFHTTKHKALEPMQVQVADLEPIRLEDKHYDFEFQWR